MKMIWDQQLGDLENLEVLINLMDIDGVAPTNGGGEATPANPVNGVDYKISLYVNT